MGSARDVIRIRISPRTDNLHCISVPEADMSFMMSSVSHMQKTCIYYSVCNKKQYKRLGLALCYDFFPYCYQIACSQLLQFKFEVKAYLIKGTFLLSKISFNF